MTSLTSDDPRTFLALLVDRAQKRPDAPLVRYRSEGEVVNMGARDLLEQARATAAGLRELGCGPGDRVALMMPNHVDVVVLWFAVALVGAVEVPVNAEQRGLVLRHVLDDSEPEVIIATPELMVHVAECGYDGPATRVAWTDAAREEIRSHGTLEVETMPRRSALATVMYTSGTTGPSKGVMLSHGYLANLGRNFHSMWPTTGPDDTFYFCSPMFHVDARCMMSVALTSGGCMAFGERFSASKFWDDIRDMKVTFFLFIGAMLAILVETRPDDPPDGIKLKAGTGAPIPPEAYDYFEDELGVRLIEVYGMTEAAAVTWSTPDRRRRGSAGYAVGPYEVAIVDGDDEPLGPDEVGEIVYRGTGPDLVTMGYWQRPETTVETFRNLWLHSGDLGRLDSDGFLWFVGREKEMIRRRGENISAYEVESTVNQFDGVSESAVVAVPGDIGGEEQILLYIVPVPGSEPTVEEIIEKCNKNLARFAQPAWIQFVESLPHTPTGKLAKHELDAEPGPSAISVLGTDWSSPNQTSPVKTQGSK